MNKSAVKNNRTFPFTFHSTRERLMKPIFSKAPPLGIRLLITIFASIALILADGRNNSITKARSAMETAIGGLYYLANSPRSILDSVSRKSC